MPEKIPVFILAAVMLAAVPGPDVFYITARGIDQGRLAALLSTWSAALGALVLTGGAAFGLSAILETSALAFAMVKYCGAAYLIYLGLRRLFASHGDDSARPERGPRRAPWHRIFGQGFIIAVLNPKTALFVVAFLPQFVDPRHGSIRLQFLLLGLILVGVGLCTDTCYALLSGTLGHWLIRRPRFLRGQRYVTGGTYLSLGVFAAASGHPRIR